MWPFTIFTRHLLYILIIAHLLFYVLNQWQTLCYPNLKRLIDKFAGIKCFLNCNWTLTVVWCGCCHLIKIQNECIHRKVFFYKTKTRIKHNISKGEQQWTLWYYILAPTRSSTFVVKEGNHWNTHWNVFCGNEYFI